MSFYRSQWPRLVAALAWSIPAGEDPEDVAQEAFARAYERWTRVREHPHPEAWLFLTAFRIATGLRRRARTRHAKHHLI
ncbi:sigma factor, partial [Streptomyces scabiei]